MYVRITFANRSNASIKHRFHRAYYNAEKQGFWHSGKWRAAKWTNRPEPPWFIRQPAPKQKEDHR